MSTSISALCSACVLLFTCIVNIEAFEGKEFFCRDPDTGKLHAVNTTWPSETFCGNYTCKLRKLNRTETQYAPIRQISVTDVPIFKSNNNELNNNNSQNNLFKIESIKNISKILNTKNDKYDPQTAKSNVVGEVTDGTDRVLNEKEIKTISKLLHDVKKSDLEAILDIYNLAQDLYKEMDKVTNANTIQETPKSITQENQDNLLQDANDFIKNNKSEHEPSQSHHMTNEALDMDLQTSNIVQTTVSPNKENAYYNFGSTLTTQDFARLPYYYPLSSFQRQYSYVHPSYTVCQNNNKSQACNQESGTTKNVPVGPPSFSGVMKKPFTVDYHKSMQPVLLPYPFAYVHHYNSSGHQSNFYYDENPWTRYQTYKQSGSYLPYYIAQLSKPQSVKAEPNIEIADDKSKTGDLLKTLLSKPKVDKGMPEWKTKPLSSNILEEVRAHFEQKAKLIKPISLRKKVNLERVGKVIKLDELNRNKRSVGGEKIEGVDLYEAYIERTTCQSEEDPGFFRMGNHTEPYPACCPQRIS
ncbi:uncharacterized protein LOC131854217 [Achroia grisella]|uniref:uncharacterized protein LOC131854217 n=1 Tax=Achroia grisella TaxID=688607 RepID=UPI0027D2CF85|nr:uncharacterized protein LOC131854217 [Achroia grisella]